MRRDTQIDYYVSLPAIDFDGDVVLDIFGKEMSDFSFVALSGTFTHDDGEYIDYLTGGDLFERFVTALTNNEMFLALVNERMNPPLDPDALRDAAIERTRLFRMFPDR